MSAPTPKPKISLKIGGSFNNSSNQSPVVSTPAATPGGTKKLKLNLSSKPSTPHEPKAPKSTPVPKLPAKSKAGRASKPSAKAAANKNGKRVKQESDDESEDEGAKGGITVDTNFRKPISKPPSKKIRLSMSSATTPKTPAPNLKIIHKGKPPQRPLGEGYDSEASDREIDPVIEEEFILRMQPGPDCDYLREAIANRTIGLPRSEKNAADVQMKFFDGKGRRALVSVRGNHYAATLVDLPTIIEGMKSWDKKGWFKSADICQMLLVYKRISRESEALTAALPKDVDPETYQYPHGITAPMRFARKRRFRKRISRTAIEAVEEEVDRLLKADEEALKVRHEEIQPEYKRGSDYSDDGYSGNEDAEGEEDDYFGQMDNSNMVQDTPVEENDEMDLEAEMEAQFLADEIAATPSSQAIADTPMLTAAGTPDITNNVEEDSGDESVEDDDEDADGDSDDEVDADSKNAMAQLDGLREDIELMEKQLAMLESQLASQVNPILRKRIEQNIGKVKDELQLKKSALGEGDED